MVFESSLYLLVFEQLKMEASFECLAHKDTKGKLAGLISTLSQFSGLIPTPLNVKQKSCECQFLRFINMIEQEVRIQVY